jgi:hypothetical protein
MEDVEAEGKAAEECHRQGEEIGSKRKKILVLSRYSDWLDDQGERKFESR